MTLSLKLNYTNKGPSIMHMKTTGEKQAQSPKIEN